MQGLALLYPPFRDAARVRGVMEVSCQSAAHVNDVPVRQKLCPAQLWCLCEVVEITRYEGAGICSNEHAGYAFSSGSLASSGRLLPPDDAQVINWNQIGTLPQQQSNLLCSNGGGWWIKGGGPCHQQVTGMPVMTPCRQV